MNRARLTVDGEGRAIGLRINCPGCGDYHVLPIATPPPGYELSPHYANGPKWTWNGDLERPVLGPSLLARSGHCAQGLAAPDPEGCYCNHAELHPDQPPMPARWSCYVCHSFIGCNGAEPGQIIFLGDCTHAHAGEVMDLPGLD